MINKEGYTLWLYMSCLHYWIFRLEHWSMTWLNYITDTSWNKHCSTIHTIYKWIHSEVTNTSTGFQRVDKTINKCCPPNLCFISPSYYHYMEELFDSSTFYLCLRKERQTLPKNIVHMGEYNIRIEWFVMYKIGMVGKNIYLIIKKSVVDTSTK